MADLPLGLNIAVFTSAAAAVGGFDVRASLEIRGRRGLGKVFVGTLLLGLTASLPETATSLVSSARRQPLRALNTLSGGVAVTMAILAVVDILAGRRSISPEVKLPDGRRLPPGPSSLYRGDVAALPRALTRNVPRGAGSSTQVP